MVVKKTGKPVPPAAVENMFQVDQSDGKFHPQSETAGIFVGGIFISPAACTTVPPPNDTQEINIAADNAADKNFFNLITLLLFSILSVIKLFILFGLHKSLLKSPSSFLIIFTFLCKLYRTIHIYA